mgnify:CR=1 FL=1
MGLFHKNKKEETVQKDVPFQTDLKKLKLLVTVVSRNKSEFYMDYLTSLGVNFQASVAGQGTANSDTMYLLGLEDSDTQALNKG